MAHEAIGPVHFAKPDLLAIFTALLDLPLLLLRFLLTRYSLIVDVQKYAEQIGTGYLLRQLSV